MDTGTESPKGEDVPSSTIHNSKKLPWMPALGRALRHATVYKAATEALQQLSQAMGHQAEPLQSTCRQNPW